MALRYKYEEGNIERVSTNRLLDINHEDTPDDFYLVHPEYSNVKELGDTLISSRVSKHQIAGVAIKRLLMMLVNDGVMENVPHLLKYAKKLNKRLIQNSKDSVKKDLSLEFAYIQIRKGFDLWKETI